MYETQVPCPEEVRTLLHLDVTKMHALKTEMLLQMKQVCSVVVCCQNHHMRGGVRVVIIIHGNICALIGNAVAHEPKCVTFVCGCV